MEHQVIWEAPPAPKVEFRLYYDDKGSVVCYTCEQLEGNFIIVDPLTFAEARYDVKVVDGKISRIVEGSYVSKLVPSTTGIACASEDISVIVEEPVILNHGNNTKYEGTPIKWKVKNYELK